MPQYRSSTSGTVENKLARDLTINLGDGVRALNLDGTNNSIGGNLTVTGGADEFW